MTLSARRAAAEFVGTAFLVCAVIGSGTAAARLSPDNPGVALLASALATGAVLTALIVALDSVSAAFNPAVSLLDHALGVRGRRSTVQAIGAQLAGGLVGAILANTIFGLDVIALASHHRADARSWLSEAIATAGLLTVIAGTIRSGHRDRLGYAVGGYVAGAYWFTSTTGFANPAVTVARMFTESPTGIAPSSVPVFLIGQVAGIALAYAVIRTVFPETVFPEPVAVSDPVPTPSVPTTSGAVPEGAA